MTVIVIATVRPLTDRRDQVVAALERAIARVHAEDYGCQLYALHEGDDRLVMIEKWSDEDALAAHGRSEAFRALTADLEGLLSEPLDVQRLRPHPVGARAQGEI